MKILSIDPGLNHIGITIFDESGELIWYKTVNQNAKQTREKRFHNIYKLFDELLETTNGWKIDLIVSEFMFGSKFDSSTIQVLALISAIAGFRAGLSYKKRQKND